MTKRLDRVTDARAICHALGGRWHGRYGLGFCPVHKNTRTPALSLADGDDAPGTKAATQLADRAGAPAPTFWSLRDEAQGWAMFASRGERCHYLAAAWGEISPDDRRRFLRRAM